MITWQYHCFLKVMKLLSDYFNKLIIPKFTHVHLICSIYALKIAAKPSRWQLVPVLMTHLPNQFRIVCLALPGTTRHIVVLSEKKLSLSLLKKHGCAFDTIAYCCCAVGQWAKQAVVDTSLLEFGGPWPSSKVVQGFVLGCCTRLLCEHASFPRSQNNMALFFLLC